MTRIARVTNAISITVRLRTGVRPHHHLMKLYSDFRGLESTYMDMYENPGMLHDVLAHIG